MSDRFRELVYTGVVVMAVGLLWTVAWARDIGSRHDGYMPAANPRMVYIEDEDDVGVSGSSPVTYLPCSPSASAVVTADH